MWCVVYGLVFWVVCMDRYLCVCVCVCVCVCAGADRTLMEGTRGSSSSGSRSLQRKRSMDLR